MRGCDVILAFPSILFAIWLISIFGPNLRNVMIAVGLFSVPSFARLVRSTILSAKEMEYIVAERAIGAGTARILLRHLLPNVIQPVIIIASLRVASAILAAAGTLFLGLGVRPPTPEWGAMLSEGRAYLTIAWWVTIFPGLAIMITVLATNMVGDGLRDALDPASRVDRRPANREEPQRRRGRRGEEKKKEKGKRDMIPANNRRSQCSSSLLCALCVLCVSVVQSVSRDRDG